MRTRWTLALILVLLGLLALAASRTRLTRNDLVIATNARDMIEEGRETFRFDTFGDEEFWGGVLRLHDAIQGEAARSTSTTRPSRSRCCGSTPWSVSPASSKARA